MNYASEYENAIGNYKIVLIRGNKIANKYSYDVYVNARAVARIVPNPAGYRLYIDGDIADVNPSEIGIRGAKRDVMDRLLLAFYMDGNGEGELVKVY